MTFKVLAVLGVLSLFCTQSYQNGVENSGFEIREATPHHEYDPKSGICSRAHFPDTIPLMAFLFHSYPEVNNELLAMIDEFVRPRETEIWAFMINYLDETAPARLGAQNLEENRLKEFCATRSDKNWARLEGKNKKAFASYNAYERIVDQDLGREFAAQKRALMQKEQDEFTAMYPAWLAEMEYAHKRQDFEYCIDGWATLDTKDPLAISIREHRARLYTIATQRLRRLSEIVGGSNITEAQTLALWADDTAHKAEVYAAPIEPGTPILFPYPFELEWGVKVWKL